MLSREMIPLFLGLPRQKSPGQDLSIATSVIFEASNLSSWSCLRGGEGRGGERECLSAHICKFCHVIGLGLCTSLVIYPCHLRDSESEDR